MTRGPGSCNAAEKDKGQKIYDDEVYIVDIFVALLRLCCDKGDLVSVVDITRDKFMEVKGASKQPDAIEKLSVQCNILQLVFS